MATHGNGFGAHGKEGVDGSSPSEGLETLQIAISAESRVFALEVAPKVARSGAKRSTSVGLDIQGSRAPFPPLREEGGLAAPGLVRHEFREHRA